MDFADIIRLKATDLSFKWLHLEKYDRFYADPFILKAAENRYNIFFEEFDYRYRYGKISMITITSDFEVVRQETILDTQSHLSYPAIFVENGNIYVLPESSKSGKLSLYKYEAGNYKLAHERILMHLPLIDSTIVKHKNRYWLFSMLLDDKRQECLNIFYSDSLTGTYHPHALNPIRTERKNKRPAGNLIEVDGVLYRPVQDSSKYYGSSISVNEIKILNESEFEEEAYFTIKPDKSSDFNEGIHTINCVDGITVVDGLRRSFAPTVQLNTFISSFFSENAKRQGSTRLLS